MTLQLIRGTPSTHPQEKGITYVSVAQAQLSENSDVDISLDGDRIVVTPARRHWTLRQLVERITPDNRHREVRWGDRTGKEIW